MNDTKITFQNSKLRQAKEGIFFDERLFLRATIQSITPCHHFTSYSSYSKEYEIKLVETGSYFPDTPLTLRYSPEFPKKFLDSLNYYGLKSDFLPKDNIEIWNLIVGINNSDSSAQRVRCVPD